MNKTKRKIFDTSLKLFAEKGYENTSIEEITATVGVAKGTLYYHFSSKEEIFDFLVQEGVKLLQNSVDIKTAKYSNYIDKIRAIILIQAKVVDRYEDIITILLSQFYGNDERNQKSKNCMYQYLNQIEEIVKNGIEAGEIKKCDYKILAAEIYGLIASGLIYKQKERENFDVMKVYKNFENAIISGLKEK